MLYVTYTCSKYKAMYLRFMWMVKLEEKDQERNIIKLQILKYMVIQSYESE